MEMRLTKLPRCGRISMKPSSASRISASRTGARLVPNRTANSFSDSRVAGGSRNVTSSCRSLAWIARTVGGAPE
jgi:hypothetical protein